MQKKDDKPVHKPTKHYEASDKDLTTLISELLDKRSESSKNSKKNWPIQRAYTFDSECSI